MQLSRGARITIWGILLGGCAIGLYLRGDAIWRLEVGPADKGLMILLAALLIWPLVAEIDLFGVKLKAQLQAAAASKQGVFAVQPPGGRNSAEWVDDSHGLSGPGLESLHRQLAAVFDTERMSGAMIPRVSQAVLAPAFLIQSEVLRLSRRLPPEIRLRLPAEPLGVAWNLARLGVLGGDEMAAIREIWSAAAKAVEGAPVAPGQARFAMDLGPAVWKRLRQRAAAFGTVEEAAIKGNTLPQSENIAIE